MYTRVNMRQWYKTTGKHNNDTKDENGNGVNGVSNPNPGLKK